MYDNIIKIEIGTFVGDAYLAIDNTQTSIVRLAHGAIAGALKAVYSPLGCKLIADYLAVSSGLKKNITFYHEHIQFVLAANRILDGIKQLFDRYDDCDFEVKRCCRYIIDELTMNSVFVKLYTKESELYMD